MRRSIEHERDAKFSLGRRLTSEGRGSRSLRPKREVEEEAYMWGPPSATCGERDGRSARGPACGPSAGPASAAVRFFFLFSFRNKTDLCFILCRKSCADPKMMKLFV